MISTIEVPVTVKANYRRLTVIVTATLMGISFFSVPPALAEEGSAKARQKQTFGVGLSATPLSDFTLQAGIELFYQAAEQVQLGVISLAGSQDMTGMVPDTTDAKLTKATLSGSAVFGFGRLFIGNSFNILAGVGQRTARVQYRIDGPSGQFLEGDTIATSAIATGGLGHRWAWESGFTIGCDWLMVMYPLSGKASSTTTGTLSGAEIDSINKDFLDSADSLSKQTSATLTLITLGWVF